MAANIDIALRDHLLLDADIASIVGTRIYPVDRPRGSDLPAIVFAKTGTERNYVLNPGPTSVQQSLSSARFDFVCLGDPADYDGLKDLARKFVAAMSGFADDITTHGRVVIFIHDEFDIETEPDSASDHPAIGVQFEIEAHYHELDE